MKQLYMVIVRGRQHEWGVPTYMDPRTVAGWRADGLDVHVVENVVPVWVVDLGLTRPWCFLQDLWNFRNPFKGSPDRTKGGN